MGESNTTNVLPQHNKRAPATVNAVLTVFPQRMKTARAVATRLARPARGAVTVGVVQHACGQAVRCGAPTHNVQHNVHYLLRY